MMQTNPLYSRNGDQRTMPAVHGIIVAAVLILGGCVQGAPACDGHDRNRAAAPPAATASFTFEGQPIHPGLVHLFEGWLADRDPVVRVVDLDAAFGTDQFRSPVSVQNGAVITSWKSGELEQTYSYRHLGVISKRYHVLRTFYRTGGTGVFQSVLLVEFETWPSTYPGEAAHQVLRLVRSMPLGDRDEARVDVVNDEVRIGASRYRKEPLVMRAP